MVDDNKVSELTKLAENGDTGKLSQAFAQIPVEDHLSYGRAIAEQSVKDHAANPNLPVVQLTEDNVPNYGQVVQKMESVDSWKFLHPSSWFSGEYRSVVYTEPKPSALSKAISGARDTLEKASPFHWITEALNKAVNGGDQK